MTEKETHEIALRLIANYMIAQDAIAKTLKTGGFDDFDDAVEASLKFKENHDRIAELVGVKLICQNLFDEATHAVNPLIDIEKSIDDDFEPIDISIDDYLT